MLSWITGTVLTIGLVGPAGPASADLPSPPIKPAAETSARPLYVGVGSAIRLQMSSKRPIAKVEIDRAGVVRVAPAYNDQTTIVIIGLKPGVVRLTLTDDTGRREVHQNGKPAN